MESTPNSVHVRHNIFNITLFYNYSQFKNYILFLFSKKITRSSKLGDFSYSKNEIWHKSYTTLFLLAMIFIVNITLCYLTQFCHFFNSFFRSNCLICDNIINMFDYRHCCPISFFSIFLNYI